MASHDGQTKTNTENTGAESVKELKQNQSPGVVDTAEGPLVADGEPVCKKPKLSDVTQDEIRIVLVGKTGVGKSNLGNSLLGSPVFVVSAHMTSETSNCSRKQKSTLTLIDTPGLFDTTKSNEESQKAIVECINLSRPGPHVFIIVVSLASRFTSEDQQTIDYIEQIFGEKSRDFMIVVFTSKHCSDLPIDDTWVKHPGQEPLKSLLEKCNYRYSSIDNKGEKVEEDVKSILQLIKQTIKHNNNQFYTGEMYDEAATLYMKYLEEKKEKEEKLERLEKEKEELRERLEKEKEELREENEELSERLVKENEELRERLGKEKEELRERLGTENEELRERLGKENEELRERLGKEKGELEKEYEQTIQNLERPDKEKEDMKRENERLAKENEQLKANKPLEEVKNILSTSCDVQCIPKDYIQDSGNVGIPLQALIMESSRPDNNQLKSYVSTTSRRQRERGPMKEPDSTTLRENIPKLSELITEPDRILESLCAKGVFDGEDREKVEREIRDKGNRAGVRKLLNLVLDCGSNALQLFGACLRECGYNEALKLLGLPINEGKSDVGCDIELISPLHEESLNCKDMESYKIAVNEYKQNINKTDGLGWTPLLKACISQYHSIQKVILLQQSGADININNNNNNNALHLACSLGSLDTVKYLIEELQFNIETPGFNGCTPLHQSSKSKISPVEKMNYLISKDVNLKTVDSQNNNALHLACRFGSLDTVIYLIEEIQFNIETRGFNGQTPLLQSSHSEVSPADKMNYLISKGVNGNNDNALHLACSLGSLNTVKNLIEELQFNIETRGFNGRTPLHQSSYSKISPVEKMKYLISKRVNVKTVDSRNDNALHLACYLGSLETVKYLIEGLQFNIEELQFNIETPGFNGQTSILESSKSKISPVEKMKYLISKGVNVKTVDSNNDNALHLACYLGSLDTVKYIIEGLQFNIETPGFTGQTPLLQSSRSKISPVEKMKYLSSKDVNVKTVDNNNDNALIRKGVNVKTVDSQNNNALHLACRFGSLSTVKYLIEELQIDIETPGLNGQTPLLQSSHSEVSPVDKMNYLIKKGVDSQNNNALHLACDLGSLDTVKYIIEELQIDIETAGFNGRTPLHQSSKSKISPVEKVKYLISKGVNVKTVDSDNNNALHLACDLGNLDTVKYLIEELQFNIETPGLNGRTSLHQSSCSEISPVEKMEYLIRKGVNVKTVDSQNINALHLACSGGSLNTVKYIIEELQFNIETPGFNGRTPLHQSSKSKISPVEKMKYLISKGVNVKTVDSDNDNALHLACELGSLETVIFLVESGFNTNPAAGKKPLLYCSRSELQPVDKIKYLISVGAKLTLEDKQVYISNAKLTETKEFLKTL